MERRTYQKIYLTEDEFTRRREEASTQLRKDKRFELAQKHRILTPSSAPLGKLPPVPNSLKHAIPTLLNEALQPYDKCRILIEMICAGQLEQKITKQGLKYLKHCVSIQGGKEVAVQMNKLNLSGVFLNFFNTNYPEQIIEIASLGLCNMATGDESCTEQIFKQGGLARFFEALDSSNYNILENTVWGIGNIIADGDTYRLAVLDNKIHNKLVEVALKIDTKAFTAVVAKALVNLVRRTLVNLPSHYGSALIHGFLQLINIHELNDAKTLHLCLSGLFHIARSNEYHAQTIINWDWIDQIITWTQSSKHPKVIYNGLQILGTIAKGDKTQTQLLLNQDILDWLDDMIVHDLSKIRKTAYWTLSNITGGTQDQKQQFLEHRIGKKAIQGICDSEQFVRLEASYMILNLGLYGFDHQIYSLFESGIQEHLFYALEHHEAQFLKNLLEFCAAALCLDVKNPTTDYSIRQIMEESGCAEKIDQQGSHQEADVYDKVKELRENYFGDCEVEVEEFENPW